MLSEKIETQITKLDNGIRVISEPVPNTNSVGISILVDAGPQNESPDQSGLAHLCEHSLFLGTNLRDRNQLSSFIDTSGGSMGGFTAPDYTCFYGHVMQDYTSYAIDLLGDIIIGSSYPHDLLEREKQVICQEIRQYADYPSDVALQATKSTLWPQDLLSRSVTGREKDVQSLDRSNVIDFITRHYIPDRIIVAAAGAVDHESFVEQAEDAFWTLRGCSPAPAEMAVTCEGGVSISRMETTQCTFSVAIPVPGLTDANRYALHMICNILGGGLSSRLYRNLRESNGLVYSIQSNILSYRRGGALVIEGVTSPEKLIESIQLIMFELTSLAVWQQPIDEEELWKSRMQIKGQSQLAVDVVPNRVARLATQCFFFGRRIDDNLMMQTIDQLTVERLQIVTTSTILDGLSNLTIAVAGPIDAEGTVYDELSGLHECYSSIASSS
jgi:predicted Zn-dependent peptidase